MEKIAKAGRTKRKFSKLPLISNALVLGTVIGRVLLGGLLTPLGAFHLPDFNFLDLGSHLLRRFLTDDDGL